MDDHVPTAVRIIGVMHKERIKMFMTSVTWSDNNEVIIYRSFQDFKKLHKQLKKRYPTPNPFRKADRMLPRFQGLKKNFQKKGPSKSVIRVKALVKYCTELLQCDSKVVHSPEVTQFFHPKGHDLDQDFAKNSIMIVPSEDLSDYQGEGSTNPQGKRLSIGNVTQPFLTQTYRTVAPYETKDTKNRPFKVDVDETLDVLIKDQKGWWLVENKEKSLAWFPAPYLTTCDDEGDDDDDGDGDGDDDFNTDSLESSLYCASRNYVSKNKDEVSVNMGSVVEALRKSDNGWWLIRFNGRVGYVPSMYLQPFRHPYAGLQKKLYSSTFNLTNAANSSSSTGASLAPSGIGLRLAGTRRQSRSMENLLEPRGSESVSLDNSPSSASAWQEDRRKSSISTDSDETDFSFSSGGSLSGDATEEPLPGEIESRPTSGDTSPIATSSPTATPTSSFTSQAVAVPPRVPPRPQTQEIFARCTTYTRKAAMASRARLLPQQMEIQTR